MNSRLLVSLWIAIGLILSASPSRAQLTLTYANAFAKDHPQVGVVADEWIARVEKATSGRVKIRHVAGGALLKPEALFEGVRKKIADCAAPVPGQVPGLLPISSSLMASIDVDTGSKLDIKGISLVTNKLFQEFEPFRTEFKNTGLRPMFWAANAPYAIISAKPTKTLSDLQGQRLRAFGSTLPKFQVALGASPIAVANAEMYTSIMTGVIDGAMTDPLTMVNYRMFEIAKNVLKTGPNLGISLTGASVIYVCNEDSWNRISKADQEAIERVDTEMGGYISDLMTTRSVDAYNELKKQGVTISELTSADLSGLATKLRAFDGAGEQLDKKGLPGSAMVKRYRELAADYLAGRLK